LFDRPRGGERAVLVRLDFGATGEAAEIEEFVTLAKSAGAEPVAIITGTRERPDPRFFIGSGKAEEVRQAVQAEGAGLALFDHPLSPSQERNLERLLGCRVLDRTTLILDIFAQRAHSFEGRLQVELAQLRHLSTRLVRGWTHLERQKGGIGLRGPGETQLETDRRLLGQRIKTLRQRLEKVRRRRETGRQARRRADIPTVSLVGYTNAGKSTLFNTLTSGEVYAADQLFATLDPTLRRLDLPGDLRLILADTVGFIRELPHELVAAFHSTLQETREAQLLLHVIDAGDGERRDKIGHVNDVLHAIGGDGVPQLEVFNKIDLLDDTPPRIDRDADGLPRRVWLSAANGEGLDLLREALAERLGGNLVRGWLHLLPSEGRFRARLFEHGAVLSERVGEDGGWSIEIQLPRNSLEALGRDRGGALKLSRRPAA